MRNPKYVMCRVLYLYLVWRANLLVNLSILISINNSSNLVLLNCLLFDVMKIYIFYIVRVFTYLCSIWYFITDSSLYSQALFLEENWVLLDYFTLVQKSNLIEWRVQLTFYFSLVWHLITEIFYLGKSCF